MEVTIPNETLDLISRILKRGNSVELKKEKDKLVVVEIQRQVRTKQTFATGQKETANRG